VPSSLPFQVTVLVLWFGLPGLACSLWWTGPTGASTLSRIALAVPIGFGLVAATGFVLASFDVLTLPALGAAWGAITVVAWGCAVRRAGLRRQASELVRAARDAPGTTIVGTALLIVYGAVRAGYGLDRNVAPTPLRYWADGLEIADARGFPGSVLHWSIEVPPTTSKVLLNVVNAQERLILGRDPLPPMAASLFVVSISLALVLVALLFECGVRKVGLAAAAALLGGAAIQGTLAADLSNMYAEDWGRMVAFAAVIPAVVAIRARDTGGSRRSSLVAGGLLGVAAGTHLVAALGAAILVVGIGIGWALVEHRLPSLKHVLAAVVTVGVVSIVVEGAVLVSAPGELGFQGAAGDRSYDAVRAELGLPDSFDPVAFLVTDGQPERLQVPQGPVEVLQALGRKFTTGGPHDVFASVRVLLLFGFGLLVCFGIAMVSDRVELRALGIGSLAALIAFLGITVAFAVRFDTFALTSFGPRRLAQYIGIAAALLVATALEGLIVRLPAKAATVTGLVAAVAVAVAVVPGARADPRLSAPDDLAALAWIHANVPCEGRVLVDRRTLASLESLGGRAGVLEGMGPHIRPALLAPAVRDLMEARDFFMHPDQGRAYLREHGVAAVVVTQGAGQRFGGWYPLAPPHPERFARAPFLHEAYRNAHVTIYTVDDWEPSAELPAIAGRPGFDC
jgi:hypothetical protein